MAADFLSLDKRGLSISRFIDNCALIASAPGLDKFGLLKSH